MKNNKLYSMFVLFFATLLFVTSCTKEEVFESKSINETKGTVTIAVSGIGDTEFTASFSASLEGYISYAIVPAGGDAPQADALVNQSVGDALYSGNFQATAPSDAFDVKAEGLSMNTAYQVFACVTNTDGVTGEVVSADAKTSDSVAPLLDGVSPSPSTAADKELDFTITLTFDEPVAYDGSVKLEMSYYFEAVVVEIPDANVVVDGNTVTVTQAHTPSNREYVFLSVPEGAIKDLSGNAYAGILSGVVDGYLEGLYWRTKDPFDINNFAGDFSVAENSENYGESVYPETIELDADVENGLILSNFWASGYVVKIQLMDGKVLMNPQVVGYSSNYEADIWVVGTEPANGAVVGTYDPYTNTFTITAAIAVEGLGFFDTVECVYTPAAKKVADYSQKERQIVYAN